MEYTLETVDDGSVKFIPRPFLFKKASWSKPWEFQDDFIIESATFNVGGQDLDTLIFRRKYGLHVRPGQVEAEYLAPLENMEGTWIRLAIETGDSDQGNAQTVWIGQVSSVKPVPQGSAASGPYGEQIFTCFGPGQYLRKTIVSRSVWEVHSVQYDQTDSTKYALCQWLPVPNDMNGKGIGNRSREKRTIQDIETYIFGGSEQWGYRWTCGQFAEYLVRRFGSNSEIEWTISGDALETLNEMDLRPEYCSGFGDSASIWDMLHAVIRPDCGFDFFIKTKETDKESDGETDGETESEPEQTYSFEIVVFSLVGKDITVGETTFKANANTLKVVSGGGHDFLRVDLAQSEEYNYSKIRIYGDRILVCATLVGEQLLATGETSPGESTQEKPKQPFSKEKNPKLDSLWISDTEEAYRDAKGTSDEDENGSSNVEEDETLNDEERKKPEFEDVFTRFGAEGDVDLATMQLVPSSNQKGEISFPKPTSENQNEVYYQLFDRKTENFVPLFPDEEKPVVYSESTQEEVDAKKAIRPLVWILAEDEESEKEDAQKYRLAGELGLNVTPLDDWIGIRMRAKPAHLIAGGTEWTGSATGVEPQWDHKTLVATIAWKSDQRVYLEYETGDEGSTLEEIYPKAQCWTVAPGTAYAYSKKKFQIQETGIVVRNDVESLEKILVAKAARYQGRGKAVVELFSPWLILDYLGTILTTVAESDYTHEINAPVTQIRMEWSGGNASKTTLSAGYPY